MIFNELLENGGKREMKNRMNSVFKTITIMLLSIFMMTSTLFTTASAENNNVASIGDNGYSTLDEAFGAAQAGDEVKILKAGTYELNTSGKDITITGTVEGVVFDNIGAKNMGGANVTFNNVTFDYYPNTNYTGLQHAGNMIYNNVTFNGQVFLYGNSETFNNCTFNQNSSESYNVWTYGAKTVKLSNCTMNSAGKSVLVYNEGANTTALTVEKTTFNASSAVEGKAAIEIDTSLMKSGTTVTVDGATTVTGFGVGSVSGSSLWNDKKNQTNLTVTVNGTQVWPIVNNPGTEDKPTPEVTPTPTPDTIGYPNTGDGNALGLWTTTLFVSLLAIIFISIHYKNKQVR